MPQKDSTVLYYVHDPMCSWCWGFRPVWQQVKTLLPKSIRLVSWVGGLAADNDQPMPDEMQQGLQGAWQRIQTTIPGTEFNYDFWSNNTPRRSTYPACRAAIAARQLANSEAEMTYGIQKAYYLQAKNPSDLSILVDVANSIGLDTGHFKSLMLSDEINHYLAEELNKVKSIGVNSFPSLVLEHNSERHGIKINYTSADSLMNTIKSYL